MNVLLAAVAERTREIGVRKAAGARRRDIIVQFLSESVIISLAGSLLGAGVGLAGAMGISAFIRWRTGTPFYAVFTWQTFVVQHGDGDRRRSDLRRVPGAQGRAPLPVDAIRYE